MKKVLGNILLVIYAIIAVFTTICLLSYNDFKVTEFGDNSFVLITNDEYTPDFNSGDLVIVNGSKKDELNVGDKVFYYREENRKVEICLEPILEKEEITSRENNFTFEDDYQISDEYIIGSANKVTVIPVAGTILSILESKWGFLFLIILPVLIAFIYEITVLITEVKENKDAKTDDAKEPEEDKKEKNKKK